MERDMAVSGEGSCKSFERRYSGAVVGGETDCGCAVCKVLGKGGECTCVVMSGKGEKTCGNRREVGLPCWDNAAYRSGWAWQHSGICEVRAKEVIKGVVKIAKCCW